MITAAIASLALAGPVEDAIDATTFAVLRIDLDTLDVGELLDFGASALRTHMGETPESFPDDRAAAVAWVRQARDLGVDDIALVGSMSGLPDSPFRLVATMKDGRDAAAALPHFMELDASLGELHARNGAIHSGSAVTGDRTQIDRYAELASDGPVQLVVFPAPFVRRAVGEMAPNTAGEPGQSGLAVLTELVSAVVTLDDGPALDVRIVASDSTSFTRNLQAFVHAAVPMLGGLDADELGRMASLESRDGALMTRFDRDELVQMVGLAVPELQEARDQAKSIKAASQIRQIVMACHMWSQDHENQFPPALSDLSTELIQKDAFDHPVDGARFEYRRPATIDWKKASDIAVVWEVRDEMPEHGLYVGFLDGHVEMVEPRRYRALTSN